MPAKYKTYAEYLSEKFPGKGKIQKIGVSIGNSCPNRDGTIGNGGCAYCNNSSFTPDYGLHKDKIDISGMLEQGKAFFARKYPDMRYLAYFQSYTNTHGASIDELMELYARAAAVKDVVGLIIGTRPDCLPDELLDRLAQMNTRSVPVMIELGAESSHNDTLNLVNRCHSWETTVDAVNRCHDRGLSVGLHFILGLPAETHAMMLETVRKAIALPIDTVKFHQLQIIKGTAFARQYEDNPETFNLFTVEDYVTLCREIIAMVNTTDIAIERFVSQAPDGLLIAPRWGLKNYQFTALL